MSNKSSFNFYCLWEELFNENFKLAEPRKFKNDPAFKLYLIQEFARLKYNEKYQDKNEWTVRRSLSKTNFKTR